MRFSLFASIALAIVFTTGFVARADAPFYAIHEDYLSTRALGMGNAFAAVVDDYNAIFYNPAALGKKRDTDFHAFLRLAADKDVVPFYNDVSSAGTDPNKVDTAVNKYYGDDMYFRAPTIGAILARPNWSLAVIPADFSANFDLHHSVAGSVFVNSFLDTTVAYGHGSRMRIPWTNKHMYWGFNLKFIHRAYYSDVIQSAQLAANEKLVDLSRVNEGATVDGDLGFLYDMYTSDDAWFKPSFAFVVRNVGAYGFPIKMDFFNHQAQKPPSLQRSFDVGTKLGLKRFWVFDPKFALDIRDMGADNWSPMKGLHAGFEFYWKMYNWWKGHWSAGINQGYWTAGFGAKMAIFQLDLASWGEEVGTTNAQQESRRYALEMSLDF